MSGRQKYPEPTVGAIILNRKGEMLLVRSHKWGHRYTVAGGHVEVGEKLEDALRREIREEVGLEVEDIRFLMTQEVIFSKEFWKRRHFIFFDYVCRCRNQTVKIDGDEIQGYEWVRPSKTLGMRLDTFTANMVRKFLAESWDSGSRSRKETRQSRSTRS